ncbi:hypothetical protein H8E07_19925 [bacterium]|nr:hypothetical protein [bacterium]
MKHMRIVPSIVAICAFATAAAAVAPHVENGAQPRDGVVDYRLEEVWRVGGPDDEENLFGVIAQVLTDENDNIYLLDQQLSEITVLSPEGERLGTLSREGDGPGETRRPNDMFFLPDGSIGLIQIFPGKIVLIDREGNPGGTFPLKSEDPNAGAGFSVLIRGKSAGGNIVLVGIDQSFSTGLLDQTYFLRGYTPEGEITAKYVIKTAQQNFADMVLDEIGVDFVWARWDLADDGSVVVAPHRNRYLLEVRDADGELRRTFSRPYEPLPRDESDTTRAFSLLEAQGRNYPVMPRITAADVEPDISAVQVQDDGPIWVTTSRGTRNQPEGVMATFDIFDAEGVYVNRVRMHAEADGMNDLLYFVDGERAVLVRNFLNTFLSSVGVETEDADADMMEVIGCRIAR